MRLSLRLRETIYVDFNVTNANDDRQWISYLCSKAYFCLNICFFVATCFIITRSVLQSFSPLVTFDDGFRTIGTSELNCEVQCILSFNGTMSDICSPPKIKRTINNKNFTLWTNYHPIYTEWGEFRPHFCYKTASELFVLLTNKIKIKTRFIKSHLKF